MESQSRRPKAQRLASENVELSGAELAVLTGPAATAIRHDLVSYEYKNTLREVADEQKRKSFVLDINPATLDGRSTGDGSP